MFVLCLVIFVVLYDFLKMEMFYIEERETV